MDVNEICLKIIGILGEFDGVSADKLNGDTNITTEVGIDSLQMIHFLLNLENEFNIEFDYTCFDFDVLNSIRHLAEYICNEEQKEHV